VGDALARMRRTGPRTEEDALQAPLAKGNLADDRWASSEVSLDGVRHRALPFAASFSHPAAHQPIPRQALARIFPSPSRRATSFCTSANLAASAVSGRAPSSSCSAGGVVIRHDCPSAATAQSHTGSSRRPHALGILDVCDRRLTTCSSIKHPPSRYHRLPVPAATRCQDGSSNVT
jgi:hypothetical protein